MNYALCPLYMYSMIQLIKVQQSCVSLQNNLLASV